MQRPQVHSLKCRIALTPADKMGSLNAGRRRCVRPHKVSLEYTTASSG